MVAQYAFELHLAAVLQDQFVGKRQTKADTGGLCGIVWLAAFFEILWAHAGTLVADTDDRAVIFRDCANLHHKLPVRLRQRDAALHGLHAVDDNVDDDMKQNIFQLLKDLVEHRIRMTKEK